MLRLGLFLNFQQPMDRSPVEMARALVVQARLAREAGFRGIAAGQHYLSPPFQAIQSLPLLARLVPETEGMDLILGVLLLPLHNPVEVAEMVASLDILSGGRVILGVGLGYRDVEYQAFGVRPEERVPRLLEALTLIRRLWSGEEVDHRGRFYRLEGARSTILPVQKPHPPIWMAANTDRAVRRAGRLGLPWFINPHTTLQEVERQMRLWEEGLREGGHPDPGVRPATRELLVAPTVDEAYALARPYLEEKYRAYTQWGQDAVLPPEERFDVPFERLARNRFILGDPETVAQQILDFHRRTGADYLVFRMQWPGMPHSITYRTLALMGEEVLPRLQKALG